MRGQCPYCDEYEDLTYFDGDRMCTYCLEEFEIKKQAEEDEARESARYEDDDYV